MIGRPPVRPRRAAFVAAVTVGLALGLAGSSAAGNPRKTHPTKTERSTMERAVPIGQMLCYPETAWISGSDRHYGVLVTQATCGATVYVHQWLRRQAVSPTASWQTVTQRSGTIDDPAGCAKTPLVPADIRCL